jgi:6-phosphogluconolactonase
MRPGIADSRLEIEILADAEAVAARGAALIAEAAADAIAARGRFTLALSGGRTPWAMIRALAAFPLPWTEIHIFQVDERAAPAGDDARNLVHLEDALGTLPIRIHPMPVEAADLEAGAGAYALELKSVAGDPPVLDLVHLGLGADGHTASLVPGDPVLDAAAEVAATGPYQGHRRITLTFPMLDQARRILWVVTGGDKADALARLEKADGSIPAGRVRQDRAWILADRAAASIPG